MTSGALVAPSFSESRRKIGEAAKRGDRRALADIFEGITVSLLTGEEVAQLKEIYLQLPQKKQDKFIDAASRYPEIRDPLLSVSPQTRALELLIKAGDATQVQTFLQRRGVCKYISLHLIRDLISSENPLLRDGLILAAKRRYSVMSLLMKNDFVDCESEVYLSRILELGVRYEYQRGYLLIKAARLGSLPLVDKIASSDPEWRREWHTIAFTNAVSFGQEALARHCLPRGPLLLSDSQIEDLVRRGNSHRESKISMRDHLKGRGKVGVVFSLKDEALFFELIRKGREDMIPVCLAAGQFSTEQLNKGFIQAIQRKSFDLADLLLREGADINVNGSEALIIAMEQKSKEGIRFLVERSIEVNPRWYDCDVDGHVALLLEIINAIRNRKNQEAGESSSSLNE